MVNSYVAIEPPGLQQPASPEGGVNQGDVTMWLTIGVIVAGSTVWMLKQLSTINQSLLEQTLLLKNALDHIRKLESKLEQAHAQVSLTERRLLKIVPAVQQLNYSLQILGTRLDCVEAFLEHCKLSYTDEAGVEAYRAFRRSQRTPMLENYMIDSLDEDT